MLSKPKKYQPFDACRERHPRRNDSCVELVLVKREPTERRRLLIPTRFTHPVSRVLCATSVSISRFRLSVCALLSEAIRKAEGEPMVKIITSSHRQVWSLKKTLKWFAWLKQASLRSSPAVRGHGHRSRGALLR